MTLDLDAELHKAEEAMKTSASALVKTGFTQEQVVLLDHFVHSAIAKIQYAVLKAERELKAESKQ